jgi:hypothetical protein
MGRSIFKMGSSKQENAPQNFNNVQLLSITFSQFASKNYMLKCGNVAQFFIAQFISSLSYFDMSVDSFTCRSGFLVLRVSNFIGNLCPFIASLREYLTLYSK